MFCIHLHLSCLANRLKDSSKEMEWLRGQNTCIF